MEREFNRMFGINPEGHSFGEGVVCNFVDGYGDAIDLRIERGWPVSISDQSVTVG